MTPFHKSSQQGVRSWEGGAGVYGHGSDEKSLEGGVVWLQSTWALGAA